MERDGFYAVREALIDRFGDVGMVTINDAAKYLNIDRRTLIRSKGFPMCKVGRQYRVPLIPLARWLNVNNQ